MPEHEAMQVGKRATVRVSILMEYTVEVQMPVDGNAGEQADLELFAYDDYDDYSEKDVVNAEIVEEEPLWETDFEDVAGYPTYV